MKSYIVLFVTLFIASSTIYSQSRAERKKAKKERIEKKYAESKQLIDSKSFLFEAEWANPVGDEATSMGRRMKGGVMVFQGNKIAIEDDGYYVEFKGNNIDMFLPYFGRVFLPSGYNSENGLIHTGKFSDLDIKHNDKKKRTIIKLSVKSSNDNHKLNLTVNAGGGTVLVVTSTNRQAISYDGELVPLQSKKSN